MRQWLKVLTKIYFHWQKKQNKTKINDGEHWFILQCQHTLLMYNNTCCLGYDIFEFAIGVLHDLTVLKQNKIIIDKHHYDVKKNTHLHYKNR